MSSATIENIQYVLRQNSVEQFKGQGVWQKSAKSWEVNLPNGIYPNNLQELPYNHLPSTAKVVVHEGQAYLLKEYLSSATEIFAPLGTTKLVALNHRGGYGERFTPTSELVLNLGTT